MYLLQPNPKNQRKKEIKVQTLSKRRVQGLERTNKKRQKKNVKKQMNITEYRNNNQGIFRKNMNQAFCFTVKASSA